MGFLDELFNRNTDKEEIKMLGRFSDAYKPSSNYKVWEDALLAYENEEYLKATINLLTFLKNPENKNISYQTAENEVTFQFFQGSKTISGFQNETKFRAEAKIAQTDDIKIGLSRRLLEKNYLLKYSRFALDEEGNILLIFDSYTVDASPNKLYQGLKEMATQADKLDDLILDEFSDLRPINNEHIIPRSEEQKEKQYVYLTHKINQCFHEIETSKLNIDQFPGGLSFLLLDLNYKLDYLLTPEGFLMDNLEKNHRVFFANDKSEVALKNNLFIKSFRKILEKDKEEIKAELYDVISTFGLPVPTPHETLTQLIESELNKMQWYKENKHTAIALAIPSYVVGYSLFSYALPMPDMKLLDLFYRVTESEFLNNGEFINGDTPNARRVKKEMARIENKYKSIHPHLDLNASAIDFSTMLTFSESFLNLIKDINLDHA
ncbi:YbjN domain-containing protein [Portibacter lacus]|uniref:Uncharacterized protein n=1 Tax=Portibacter lacus TaxID=1099794 RepID=A0AA37WGV6_9BACT|nr:YbjN domain-containing protein [Portibacter lacus]GLR18614.1 hypothetical protein GCM10007940_32300 [Portibacter lacus]